MFRISLHPIFFAPMFIRLSLMFVAFGLICCDRSSEIQKDIFAQGAIAGVLNASEIDEASGLAASHTHPGMLWTHNDSGDKSRIFLIDSIGQKRATLWLSGISNRDWEDIAVGPGPQPDKTYVYIGEIGDNRAKHKHKYIYRFPEPTLVSTDTTLTVEQIDSIKFVLPDGSRDCEALMIDPDTKDLYIFSKRETAVNVYRLPYPQSTTELMEAEKVLEGLPLTLIVAADWSADGKEILIKDYERVYYWKRNGDEPVSELLTKDPILLPYHQEPQGESIAFDYFGKGYYTLSEKAKGVKPTLMVYKRIEK
ncbi:MAG: hypothetical protein KF687_01235 [Cyclobacteriaceae bacterium]|nr:hypothetical protein [Cyclobacteriaceae bacterium]